MNTCKIYLSNVDKSGKYSSTCKNTSEYHYKICNIFWFIY